MAQATNYKRTLGGSIGAGMKSVMGGDGRRYFILEHKVSSKYHKAGENQKIIVDQIEIGRDPKAQVRFDESFNTVSRKHAAIVRDGDNWKLIPLSQTNSTYLNGHKVDKEWYLQNGDEIQLSTNGPKLGFITPAGDKGLVKSIGMTARLNLFRQQALRPYKTAITCLGIILVAAVTLGSIFLRKQYLEIKESKELIAKQDSQIQAANDSLLKIKNEAIEKDERHAADLAVLRDQLNKVKEKQRHIVATTGQIDDSALTNVLPYVYFIYPTTLEITLPDGKSGVLDTSEEEVPSWCGTGFLLEDGRFVTARHVIDAWDYWVNGNTINEGLQELNAIANNNGKVKANFVAVSSSGDLINLSSDQFKINKDYDLKDRNEAGLLFTLGASGNVDYAYAQTGKSGGLKSYGAESNELHRNTKLTILGFPMGEGLKRNSVDPISSSATVGANGLSENGLIVTSESNINPGNSGGPALIFDENNNYSVVGIVSAIQGRSLGYIVPISVIR